MHFAYRFLERKANAKQLIALVLLLLTILTAKKASAGGGPENLFLVINANSQNSMEVGNHYARLQNLPVSNVLHLPYEGDLESVSGDVFREQILKPIIEAINARGLAIQIDMITYSCDMPWRVDFRENYPKEPKPRSERIPMGSTTGATYLWQTAFSNDPRLMGLNSNWYVPRVTGVNLSKCKQLGVVPTRAFRGRYGWKVNGDRAANVNKGRRYFMSTMLGVTTGRGNTVDEVIASLRRSSYANVVPPVGAFYFMRNKDVRSKTRHACYDEVVNQLKALGAEAYVQEGTIPNNSGPILGMMLGKANLPLKKAKFTVQPGAICEHLTSFGGMLKNKNWQTPITDLIRLGASGVSGTVTEPHAIQAKFPLPSVHLHYRRGCSLAEAFYQSVASPYQLLIIGDPLCQPWAKRPQVTCPGWKPDSQVPVYWEKQLPTVEAKASKEKKLASNSSEPHNAKSADNAALVGVVEAAEGEDASEILSVKDKRETLAQKNSTETLTTEIKQRVLWLTPRVVPAPSASLLQFGSLPSSGTNLAEPKNKKPLGPPYWELFIDGKLLMRLPSGRKSRIVVDSLKPGWHDLRCVGMSPDALETQGVLKGWINIPADEETSKDRDANSYASTNGIPIVKIASASPVVPLGGSVELSVESEGAQAIVVRHFAREVARLDGSKGKVSLPAEIIGKGPIRLQAYSEPSGAASPPLWIAVE